jgi:hypothetical protein
LSSSIVPKSDHTTLAHWQLARARNTGVPNSSGIRISCGPIELNRRHCAQSLLPYRCLQRQDSSFQLHLGSRAVRWITNESHLPGRVRSQQVTTAPSDMSMNSSRLLKNSMIDPLSGRFSCTMVGNASTPSHGGYHHAWRRSPVGCHLQLSLARRAYTPGPSAAHDSGAGRGCAQRAVAAV